MERGEKEAEKTLHKLFERQAKLSPDAPALSDENSDLTYRELDEKSSRLASKLRESGAAPDVPVGVYMERCVEYVISMLAAMKSGGAYLPLELAYPKSMLEDIAEEAKPSAILTKKRHAQDLPHAEAVNLDAGWEDEIKADDEDSLEVSPENLAFVAYSSGTTGRPKGIANSHRAAATSYLWRFETSDYGPGDVVGCNVFFVWEVLRPLLRGGAARVVPDDVIYDPHALVELLEERRITETLMTPSLLETTLNNVGDDLGERLPSLRTLWLNGEVVTKPLASRAAKALPNARLLNVYSISETHEVAAGDLGSLMKNSHSTHCPVGTPISPRRTYILGEDMNLVPNGEDGELYVGGECLARGYVGLPEKTAERFLDDPFASEGKMYKTGDQARLLPNGDLEILGRCDFMVKVRGYSIELGAVESAIEDALPVKGCVVVTDGEEGEDKRLVAYLVPKKGASFDVDEKTGRSPEIRAALKDSLPHYAVPAAFVVADSLPLQGTTGKVDRTELPPPPERNRGERVSAEDIKLPENPSEEEVEAVICRVWEYILRLDEGEVSPEDNFFDIGGHSLAAAETLAKIEEIFGVRRPVGAILESPTPASFRKTLRKENDEGRSEPDPASDAILEESISPRGETPRTRLSEARKVFLTGATGFLGAFLLYEILARAEAEVHLLVRRRGGSPMRPIRANLERHGLWRDEFSERLIPVPGSLDKPRLGLEAETFETLSENLDLVFHSAAAVNLVYPYSALRSPNVEGTREILRLCCEGRPKPLHYVSTNGVFPPGTGECLENADLDPLLGGLEDGYGVSKWVAEKLVWEASERGLPVSVYRPGNVSGHSETGASNPKDFLTAMLSESVRIEAAPEVPGWRMEMTPADFVAEAILEISEDPASFGKAHHLANPEPPAAEEVFDRLEDLGVPLERLEIRDWMEKRSNAGHSREDIVGGVLGPDPAPQDLLEENRHDDSNTRLALENSGLQRRPDLDAELLENYLRHFKQAGWTRAPAASGKRTA